MIGDNERRPICQAGKENLQHDGSHGRVSIDEVIVFTIISFPITNLSRLPIDVYNFP
jgi:hypothetical protein